MSELPHIAVCICTYRRASLLKQLLQQLVGQKTGGRFTYSIVVVDNDATESAAAVVTQVKTSSSVPVNYFVETRQNIALARNKAVANAAGNFVAFIDDDEEPGKTWLLTLFEALHSYDVDGVLGPVWPKFELKPPAWIIKGKFYDRPSYPTGFVIDGRKGRTGNVLLRKALFEGEEQPFNPRLLTGEDQEFFGRMIALGHVFVWCEEAFAYEIVPASRWKRSFMLRRALLRGKISLLQPGSGAGEIVKSLVAIPLYTLALPIFFVCNHGSFMKYLVKLCDHVGRLLGALGLNPIKDVYVTE